MTAFRYIMIPVMAVTMLSSAMAQTFTSAASAVPRGPVQREEGTPVCGDPTKFNGKPSLNNLPGCIRIDTGGCIAGAGKCLDFRPYTLVKGKPELASAPPAVSIVALDDLGYYKAQCFLTSTIISQSTNFKNWIDGKGIDVYQNQFDRLWEYREHMQAIKSFRELLREAEANAKAGSDPDNKSLLRTLPIFGRMADHFVKNFMSGIEDQLISQVNLIDGLASVKAYGQAEGAAKTALAYLQLVKDVGAADDAKILGDGNLRDLPVRTLGPLRAQLSAYADWMKTKADSKDDAENDKWAPYLAVVKGDRLEFLNLYRKGWNIYGPGRVPVVNPAGFMQAPALFTCEITKGQAWEVRGVKFEGDKKVGGDYFATGMGSTCPSSAFQH